MIVVSANTKLLLSSPFELISQELQYTCNNMNIRGDKDLPSLFGDRMTVKMFADDVKIYLVVGDIDSIIVLCCSVGLMHFLTGP